MIKTGLTNFRKEIEEMAEDEKKNEEPDKIVNIAEKILEFNKQSRE